MNAPKRLVNLRAYLARIRIICVCLVPLVGCDEDDESTTKAQAQRQLQVQLEQEQARRHQAERAAVAAEESRNAWVIGVGMGAFGACLITAMIGIHIGSRAVKRSGKEANHG
jgi:tetrahydromethanopterin S-methyltransferase subunit E